MHSLVAGGIIKHMKEYHNVPSSHIGFGVVGKNNLLSHTKVINGTRIRYITCHSGGSSFATIEVQR